MFKRRLNLRSSRRKNPVVLGLLTAIFVAALGVFLFRQAAEPRHTEEMPEHQAQQVTPEAESTPEESTASHSLVTLTPWKVRFRPHKGLGEIAYKDLSKEGLALVGFSTLELQKVDGGCVSDNAPLGLLERSQDSLTHPDGTAKEPLATLGGYNYYFTSPQASCLGEGNDSEDNLKLLETQTTLLRSSLSTLELIP